MDERLQQIIDEARVNFGLDAYELERHSINKERDSMGEAYYIVNMEWFPKELTEPVEDDMNPAGTACMDYNIQEQRFDRIIFTQEQSFSTISPFVGKTLEEVATWLEKQTGLTYGIDFKLTQACGDEFHFEMDIEGVRMSPGCMMIVEFDEMGKLTSYSRYGTAPREEDIKKSAFTLTLEEIEPLVKKQLQLVNFPSESENRFIPAYAMEEVFVTVDGQRIIPFFEHERTIVKVDAVLEWDHPLVQTFKREELHFVSESTVEVAFGQVAADDKLLLTDHQIERSKGVVRDVLRSEYPHESGKWRLAELRRQENFIEAHCRCMTENSTVFNRKVVVFIKPETMSVLNFVDNGAMVEIFDTFAPAEQAVVTHDEAFEKMVPYITLDPTYVYDELTGKYILCGLLDAAEAVDAVTGEVISLNDL
ncbi:hypothetical protein [Sporosarcina sp. YIM B06819]|uniref:hypothetical protein n=1 Tax=Sporosarcina sp. YIM B06819 TaxID=3081769 RepID=UPI00298C88C8|nr:hypothetical protein [Sporosarcina sp. YIM B06819]